MIGAKGTGGALPAAWLAGAGLVLVVAIPFAFIVLQAIFPALGSGSFRAPFANVLETLANPALLRMTFNTVLLGAAVVAAAALLAVPLGVLRALFRVPLAPLWDVLLLVPFMIPPYIATLGWIMTLQPRGYLHQLAGFHLAPFLFSLGGMTLIMALNTFPVVYFAVSRTVEAVGARYSDVARLFGATPARAFWRITLPLAAPGLAASLLLVFAMAIEEYGTPAALGRRAGFEVLVSGIDLRVSDWPIDLPGAAVISLVLVLLSFLAFLLQRRILAAGPMKRPAASRRTRTSGPWVHSPLPWSRCSPPSPSLRRVFRCWRCWRRRRRRRFPAGSCRAISACRISRRSSPIRLAA